MSEKFYVDENGVFLGSIEGDAPEGGIEVPSAPPVNALQVWIDGEWLPADPVIPSNPTLCCLANLSVAGFDVSGIDTAVGLIMAFAVDTGVVWVFFTEPMINLQYSPSVTSSIGTANVFEKALDYIEIRIKDGAGEPLESAELAIQIFKVI